MSSLRCALATCGCGFLLVGCGEPAPTDSTPDGPTVIQAANYPLFYFTDRIAGELVDVRFVAPADGDPAFWTPDDDAIEELQSATRILLNGATYSKWTSFVSLPESRIVRTGRAFQDNLIVIEEGVTHSHGEDGDHSHEGTAFTTWLDLDFARQHADAIRIALTQLHPEHEETFDSNAASLFSDLASLDAELKQAAGLVGTQPLVASHPVYQYLARRYGLDIESVLWEPETVPSDADMTDLQVILDGHPAEWMVWEGDPAEASVAKLDAIGVRSVVFDPCGNRPDSGDWLTVMRSNVSALRALAE